MQRLPDRDDGYPFPCCDWGWVVLVPGPVPTVAPCFDHQPGLFALWLAGAFRPEVPDWWRAAA